MSEAMTSQFAFSFPDPTSSSTQQANFTSFSPGQTYITSEPNGNSKKSLGRDSKRGIIILSLVSFEEHIDVQRETKARTLSLEIDVKGGSSYGSKGTNVAPTHSAFIGAASTNTKMVYSDQPSHSSLITCTSSHSGSIMEDVLRSFVVENEPTQQLAYEDFEQVDQMEMEELDIKWQMAMLSLIISVVG
nr:hypothetical protein [Tanacetum cinerariifolium]